MRLEKKATMENAKELRIEAMEKDTILGKNAERILKIKSQTCRASGIFHIIGTFFLCIHTADILHEERNTRKDLVNREPLIGRMRCMCQF